MQQPRIKDLKPGDKFTAEFTVDDKYKATNGAFVSYSRIDDYSSIFYKMEPLSVTQAPREPKVGDKFVWKDGLSTYPKTILFIDDNHVFYEFTGCDGKLYRQNNTRENFNRYVVLQ